MEILNDTNFDEAIASGITVIDFFANWCGPCKMLSPILEETATDLPEVKFYKVDVDASNALASRYQVASIPNLIIFKDGKAVDQIVGFTPKNQIIDKIRAVM